MNANEPVERVCAVCAGSFIGRPRAELCSNTCASRRSKHPERTAAEWAALLSPGCGFAGCDRLKYRRPGPGGEWRVPLTPYCPAHALQARKGQQLAPIGSYRRPRSSPRCGTIRGLRACIETNGEPCERCAEAIPHGTSSGYSAWGCRCDVCRPAGVAYTHAWQLANPERHSINARTSHYRRQARKAGAWVPEWDIDVAIILDRDGSWCSIGAEIGVAEHPIAEGAEWCVDHIIPISVGGWHASWNVQIACRQCNAIKYNGGDRGLQERKVIGWQHRLGVSHPLYSLAAVDPWFMPGVAVEAPF